MMKERLKELLEERGISYQKLSNETGVSTNTIFKIIKGKSESISTDTLIKLCKFFDVSTDYFLGLSDIRSTDYENADLSQELGISVHAIQNVKRLTTRGAELEKEGNALDTLDAFLSNEIMFRHFLHNLSILFSIEEDPDWIYEEYNKISKFLSIPSYKAQIVYRSFVEGEIIKSLNAVVTEKNMKEEVKKNEKYRKKLGD